MLVSLNKPWFVYRPTQALRRIRVPDAEVCDAPLPWGHRIEVCPREQIGSSIARTGVFELAVSEVIARLLDPADLAVDAGANVGYMTSLMVSKASKVLAFEPHPHVYARLARNVTRWPGDIEAHQLALSDRAGRATLTTGAGFTKNMGTARLGEGPGYDVRTERLDSFATEIGLLKVDVEGHELAVLRGCNLDGIRDVVFEETGSIPSPVTDLLAQSGFEVFALRQRFRGVELVAPGEALPMWDAPTFLATRAPGRAKQRVGLGWTVLQ